MTSLPSHSRLTLAAHALDRACISMSPQGRADLAAVANWLQEVAAQQETESAAEQAAKARGHAIAVMLANRARRNCIPSWRVGA